MIQCFKRGHKEVVLPLFKEEPLFSWRVSGLASAALDQVERIPAKYNYDEIVSRLKPEYFYGAERERQARGRRN
jgi:hypothetical protein